MDVKWVKGFSNFFIFAFDYLRKSFEFLDKNQIFLTQISQRGLGLRPSAATKKLKDGSCKSGEKQKAKSSFL